MSDTPFDPSGPIGGGPVFDPAPELGRRGGCFHADGDYQIPDRRLLGLNRCHNATFGMDIRPEELFDGSQPWYSRRSYMEPRSESPIRAVPRLDYPAYAELCSYHYGHLAIGNDSYMRAQFCSTNIREDNMTRTTVAKPYIKAEGTPGRQPTSYMKFDGPYEAEPWSVVHFHGEKQVCGTPI